MVRTKLLPVADDPAGAHDVVARHNADDGVAGGLRLAVDAQRASGSSSVWTSRVPSKT